MKQYDIEKPLISLHIPKCAGISFSSVLKIWFKENLYRHYFDEKNNKMPSKHNLKRGLFRRRFKKGVCIHGHFNRVRRFGVIDYYPELDQFITILRDPLEMALSNYFFIKRLGDMRFRDGKKLPVKDQFKDVNDYLQKVNSYLLNLMPYEMTEDNYEEIFERFFVYVGIVEDIQTSVNMLAKNWAFLRLK